MRNLWLIHVGPVQEFIASARRSRDLWFGSWLLSELSKTAARTVAERNGMDSLIFPCPGEIAALQRGSALNVANRIVAVIEQPPEEMALATQQAVIKCLRQVRDSAYGHIRDSFERHVAEQQVDDLVEFYWAALPFPPAADYAQVRSQLEAVMAARKVTRDFAPVTWGRDVPKSSLDGLRESVIPELVYDQVRRGQMNEEMLRHYYGVGKAERLCGVGLLKRHGQRGTGDRFFSTSHVAALPLLHRITDKATAEVGQYLQALKDLGIAADALSQVPGSPHPAFGSYDGHLLFEERLSEFFADPDALTRARKALKEFLTKAADGRCPLPYYALLVADGDWMGRVIDHQKTIQDHRRLSQALSEFAARVPDVVVAYNGSPVYAGGDDVLAFLPLHTALACAQELVDDFRKALQGFRDADGHSPTLSVGVAVSHHLEPLSDALELSRSAEKIAKAVLGKEALAVTISKRSGVDRTVSGRWGTVDERLRLFVQLHRLEAIPDGAAYELHSLAQRLQESASNQENDTLQKAMRIEAVRILKRKRAKRGKEAVAQNTLKYLEEFIVEGKVSVEQLANELVVARTFAQAADLANLPLDEEESSHANLDH